MSNFLDAESRQAKIRELNALRDRVAQLEQELLDQRFDARSSSGFYTGYYATTGFLLGGIGAATSLLFNVVGSLAIGQHPLQLIRVYLTFPLGEQALSPELQSGLTLAIGCCLYLATGMLLGIPFQLAFARFTDGGSLRDRLLLGTLLGAMVWIVSFYLILSWLQPLLFGGDWIVREIPWWVGLVTHLVFGWTMALVYPLGRYVPYDTEPEIA